jgi:hypothetical protein
MKYKSVKNPLYVIVALLTLIVGWQYINTYLYKSRAAGSANGVSIQFAPATSAQPAPLNTDQTTVVTVSPNVATYQISAVDLTFQASGNLQFVSIAPTADFTTYDQLVQTVTATSIRVAYTNKDLTKSPKFLITYRAAAQGAGGITLDTTKTQVVGTVDTIAFVLDNIGTASFNFGTGTQPGADTDVIMTFTPQTGSFPAGSAIQTATINITPRNPSYSISAIDLNLTATSPIQFVDAGVPAGFNASEQLIKTVNPQTLRIAYASLQAKQTTSIVVQFTGAAAGTGSIQIAAGTQIVGTLPSSAFTMTSIPSGSYTFTGVGQPTATPVPGQPTATPIPGQPTATTAPGQPTATTAPGQPTVTPVPTLGPSPTPNPKPNVNIKIKITIRFQGIGHGKHHKKSIIIHVIVNGTTSIDKIIEVIENSDGTYTGIIDALAKEGLDNQVYIKGFHHLQRKFCKNNQKDDDDGGSKNHKACDTGTISLSAGSNALNFEQSTLITGDTSPQDGVVDSFDLAQVRKCIGHSDDQCVGTTDLNNDGIVDSQDMSLVVQALNVKYDDGFNGGAKGTQQGSIGDQF